MYEEKRNVCAMIVTYNRRKLLEELLDQLLLSRYSLKGIIIVNNDSPDSTDEMLLSKGIINLSEPNVLSENIWKGVHIYYYRNSENIGGSGGFAKAFGIAQELNYDCYWVMDDDVFPEEDCLGNLLQYLDNDAEVCVPCRGDDKYIDYAVCKYDLKNPLLFHGNNCKRNLLDGSQIKEPYVYVEDMTFEGPLFTKGIMNKAGLPDAGYFILYDDTDYAHRVQTYTQIRYIPSAILHKRLISNGKGSWGWKVFYNTRNAIYFDSKYGKNWTVRKLRPFFRICDLIMRSVLRGNFNRIKWLCKAYCDGCRGRMGKAVPPGGI